MHIVGTSLVSLSFLLSSPVLLYMYVSYFYFYFVFSWFSLKHMFGYSQSQPTAMVNCTYCFISHSEEIKYITENGLSIGEQTEKKCIHCIPPFKLYCFPSILRNEELRNESIRALKKQKKTKLNGNHLKVTGLPLSILLVLLMK